jgi:hypothetical protein
MMKRKRRRICILCIYVYRNLLWDLPKVLERGLEVLLVRRECDLVNSFLNAQQFVTQY